MKSGMKLCDTFIVLTKAITNIYINTNLYILVKNIEENSNKNIDSKVYIVNKVIIKIKKILFRVSNKAKIRLKRHTANSDIVHDFDFIFHEYRNRY